MAEFGLILHLDVERTTSVGKALSCTATRLLFRHPEHFLGLFLHFPFLLLIDVVLVLELAAGESFEGVELLLDENASNHHYFVLVRNERTVEERPVFMVSLHLNHLRVLHAWDVGTVVVLFVVRVGEVGR